MFGLTLATLVPVGTILPGAIVTFFVGLGLGGLAQRELDRALRAIAVRRAVQATVAALESASGAHPTPDIRELGMPYRRTA